MEEEYDHPIYTRTEAITEEDDKNLAGATKEYRNDLHIIIPENPFPEIEVDSYPPLKFSWVIPKKLAAMAFPRHKENVQFIVNQGITHLVTLTAGKKPPVEDVARLNWTEIPVIGIHCRQGRTRCGVMLACYLVHFHRFEPEQAMNGCEEAVGQYFIYLTEDNPLRFGVSAELMQEWVEAARTYTKKVLGEL
ncbi:putative dual specificity phosphatase 23-like protein [Operophtera brumata]|uniref:Putative dual specificity phosphatase 23-like protein n=1 Tax=Operophtera brumata TaxID=104452 RepID=A0A0L7LVN5_OPEBR|nr:putative dual specificity phosphatase 23-like protein [Operophtera brumata]